MTSNIANFSGGPRTPQGKERSRRNAQKHGVFSKVVLLVDESKSDFDSMLNGLREDYRPDGSIEEILVEKLATLVWRQRRALIAEAAEIRKSREFLDWDKHRQEIAKADEQARKEVIESVERLGDSEFEITRNVGLVWQIDNAVILDRCLELLRSALERVKSGGLFTETREIDPIFESVYGSSELRHLSDTLYKEFLAWRSAGIAWHAEGNIFPEREITKMARKIEAEIKRLEQYKAKLSAFEAKRIEIEALRQAVPDSPGLERLMRYETSLERQFDRTLNQLERIQRMRKGQNIPPPIKLDVTTS